ncbi:hypothetical protein SY83_04285 [Paenibacillus swuensis]|uniref:Uncharacterized protein n=1 Tax=Paenibacillus swuensis TaxID=1178515 RepID=A0A172TFD3_9BACL|nr:hypothetical protein SY83_04285 [Paenibacillus swuensis]
MSKKNTLILLVLIATISVGLVIAKAIPEISSVLNLFRNFTVVIHNQSDHAVKAIEIGVDSSGQTKGTPSATYNRTIQKKTKVKFTPQLRMTGEGSIYLKYTDSKGNTVKKTICSYTETLSGHSKVTIKNNEVTVVEDCT